MSVLFINKDIYFTFINATKHTSQCDNKKEGTKRTYIHNLTINAWKIHLQFNFNLQCSSADE